MRSCPKCGANKDKHGKWTCRSFPHGAEFRQSLECRLSSAYQLIETMTAERDKLMAAFVSGQEAKPTPLLERLHNSINEQNEIEKD